MKLLFFQHFFEGEFAGIDGQNFFDLRELFLQKLFRPQTEGKFTTSVEASAYELQRDSAVLRVNFQQFSVPFGQFFQSWLQFLYGPRNPLLERQHTTSGCRWQYYTP